MTSSPRLAQSTLLTYTLEVLSIARRPFRWFPWGGGEAVDGSTGCCWVCWLSSCLMMLSSRSSLVSTAELFVDCSGRLGARPVPLG